MYQLIGKYLKPKFRKLMQGFIINKFLVWMSHIVKGRIELTFPGGSWYIYLVNTTMVWKLKPN